MAVNIRALLLPLDQGEPVEIVKDMTLVGRTEDCDLRLDHKSVSKMHCVIVKTDGLLLVRDLGSTNGTRVNGQRVRRAALLPNDKLSIANFQYKVTFGPPAAPAAAEQHNERTQQLDAREVAQLLARKEALAAKPAVPVQANQLPDVYPDDEQKAKM